MIDYERRLPDPCDYGYIHKDDLPDLDAVTDWVHGVLEAVYETGDRDALDNALEELCYQLDIPFNLKQQAVS